MRRIPVNKTKNELIALFIITIIFLLISSVAFSQVPEKMSYQAVITDNKGDLVINKNIDIRLQIVQDTITQINTFKDSITGISTTYIVVYDEEFHVKTNANGLINFEIGSGKVNLNSFDSINWSKGPCMLLFEVDMKGKKNYTDYWKNPFTTVPYAFYAKTTSNQNETDPVFNNSLANKISLTDIDNWNSKLDIINEIDPIFSHSFSKSIRTEDTLKWNHKLDAEKQNLGNVLALKNIGNYYQIKQLADPTEANDLATKAYVDALQTKLDNLVKKLNSYYAGGFVTDMDGNQYNTVRIGNQIWMSENLRTTRFNDSTIIPVSTNNQWQDLTTPVYCWYNNDEAKYKIPYGAYYNYYAVATKKLCPVGWRVPDYSDWQELINYLGGYEIAGGKLKTVGNRYWDNPNTVANNSSGFYGVGGGYYIYSGKYSGFIFNAFHNTGKLWSSTADYGKFAWNFDMGYYDSKVILNKISWQIGENVRCLKEYDSTTVHKPIVYADSILSVTDSSAIIKGIISSSGGSKILFSGVCWDTIPNPDTTSHYVLNDKNDKIFYIPITGMEGDKRYFVRVFARNIAGISYSKCLNLVTSPGTSYMADTDGNYYKIVKIGNQTWMAENLRTTILNDGTPIDYGTTNSASGYKWYTHDTLKYKYTYGALYGRNIVSSKKLCPVGWHIPTNSEWETLGDILGGMEIAGGKMKETGTSHWNKPNVGATNESGFNAIPGGFFYHYEGGHGGSSGFTGMGIQGLWSSYESSGYIIENSNLVLKNYSQYSDVTASVRCKLDDLATAKIPEISTVEIVNILPWTANSGGTILSDGGSAIIQKGVCWSNHPSPDTNNFKTKDGYASKDFTSFINNLLPQTTYYVRAYAINKLGVAYGNEMSFTTKDDFNYGSVTDIEGNTYKTIKIVNQTWMAENLKSTRFNNGDSIPYIIDNSIWKSDTLPAYCNYNDSREYSNFYGKLYNYYTVNDTRNVCPAGWHIPTNPEWTTLNDNMGGAKMAGIKLLEAGTSHWTGSNKATNESGFSAIPTGYRYYSGYYSNGTYWWLSADSYVSASSSYNSVTVYGPSTYNPKANYGYSVRCLKNVDTDSMKLPTVSTDSIFSVYQHIATASGKIISDGGSVIIEKGICWDTLLLPVKEKNKIVLGISTAPFSCPLKNLKANTIYYVRAYAINSKGIAYGKEQEFNTKEELPYGLVSDVEGNVYKTIQIGNQTWMAENLKTKKYSNGDTIGTTYPGNKSIFGEAEPKYQWPYYDYESKVNIFGRLYTWYAVTDSRNVCPAGWHVPDIDEWSELIDTLGGATIAGKKLKEALTYIYDWNSNSNTADNESGFSAIPAGGRSYYGYFSYDYCYWWTADQYNSYTALYKYLTNSSTGIYNSYNDKKYAMSIRCLKD